MNYTAHLIDAMLDVQKGWPKEVTILLHPGDVAHNVATTNHRHSFDTDMFVTTTRYKDGGLKQEIHPTAFGRSVVREHEHTMALRCAVCDHITGWRALVFNEDGALASSGGLCNGHPTETPG